MIHKLKENRVRRSYLGGARIDKFYGKETSENGYCPEDWIGSVVEANNPGDVIPGEGLGITETGEFVKDVLSQKSGAFSDSALPEYDAIYREVLKNVDTNKCVDTDSRFIRLTEHIIDKSNRYIVAINLSDKNQKCNLIIKEGWGISEQYYNPPVSGTLNLASNDAAIFKLSDLK